MHEFIHQLDILSQRAGDVAHDLHDVVFVEGFRLGFGWGFGGVSAGCGGYSGFTVTVAVAVAVGAAVSADVGVGGGGGAVEPERDVFVAGGIFAERFVFGDGPFAKLVEEAAVFGPEESYVGDAE